MRLWKAFLVMVLVASVFFIAASYAFACEECVQADAGFHGCQGGHASGHTGCTPAANGSGCSVSGNCGGLKQIH